MNSECAHVILLKQYGIEGVVGLSGMSSDGTELRSAASSFSSQGIIR